METMDELEGICEGREVKIRDRSNGYPSILWSKMPRASWCSGCDENFIGKVELDLCTFS